MKKRNIPALILCVVLCMALLAGCGNTATPTPASSSSSAAAAPADSGSQAAETAQPTERPTVTFMGVSYTTTPLSAQGADEVVQYVEDYADVNIDFTWVSNDSYKEKLGVTLMSAANMPMILTVPALDATIIQAAKAGAFWDLNPIMFDSAKFPNLSQANENVNKLCSVDGQLIGIYRSRPIGRNGFGYRQDWADKLGLDTPKTLEDFYNMCEAFTKQDPDGNGKDDTYGMVMYKNTGFNGPIEQVISWFGGGNTWTELDGKLVPNHMVPEWMEAIDYLRKMYEEGLIYRDWAVRDPNNMLDYMRNGECGVFVTVTDDSRRVWDYFVANDIPAATGDGIASMALIGTLAKDANSPATTIATSGMNGMFSITKAAQTEQDVEACLRLLDRMSDDDMRVLSDYGMEGRPDGWDYVDGFITLNDASMKAEVRAHYGINQLNPYVPAKAVDPRLKLDERRQLEEEVKSANVASAVFDPAAGYRINSPTYGVNGANMDQIIIDARTQYICGQIDKTQLEAAFDNWEKQGGTQVIEEVNEMYQADK